MKVGVHIAKTPGLLLLAVENGSVEMVRYLLERGLNAFGVLSAADKITSSMSATYADCSLPIEVAALRGQVRVVETLLQHYSKPLPISIPLSQLSEDLVMVASTAKGSLLWNAAMVGNTDLLKVLIKFGLSIEYAINPPGATAQVYSRSTSLSLIHLQGSYPSRRESNSPRHCCLWITH